MNLRVYTIYVLILFLLYSLNLTKGSILSKIILNARFTSVRKLLLGANPRHVRAFDVT